MQEIKIKNYTSDNFFKELNSYLRGTIEEKWGEHILTFSNTIGSGTIKMIDFDWGVKLIDFDVNFNKDIKLTHDTGNETPIEFIFISEGNLRYMQDVESEEVYLERYQNIIISPKMRSKKTFVFPKKVNVRVNFIQVSKKQYAKKKNNNLDYLNDVLSSVFKEETYNLPYSHYGNFNLEIEDHLKKIRSLDGQGAVRTLNIEGRLNIILAMQILEQHKFENNSTLPESLTKANIKKLHQLAGYVLDNIAEPLTIAALTSESGLSAKKLQSGFKMLYGKTVNEYIKNLKLEISRDYLKNTEYSVSEIVYRVGIKSRSYFSKIFSEHYGVLPTEYRAQLKGKLKS
ncbi:helix-turn-helix transcriptional regulator [Flagellimonas sp. 389]|uniref:helix-turn-helix domain-containing protein n=1 Tax=Flagellimonas sp. 389 TaxID=2835862 RepID=UPI001BD4248E|nr:AraC family transcriptional regulator [Flagellimonas sp. 389]MBS9464295.1 helix-turn-helix transcriptional regulator [Flagellimonas sp. 389]